MNKPGKAFFMDKAIKEARKNLKTFDGGPFGACIVKGDRIIAVARNTVLKDDATCHAEVNAIRMASKKLGTFDLSGCDIYSTTEPCPMCFIRLATVGVDTKYCTPGPDDGMVNRVSCLPQSWVDLASKCKYEKANSSPVMQKTAHLLFFCFFLDNRGPK